MKESKFKSIWRYILSVSKKNIANFKSMKLSSMFFLFIVAIVAYVYFIRDEYVICIYDVEFKERSKPYKCYSLWKSLEGIQNSGNLNYLPVMPPTLWELEEDSSSYPCAISISYLFRKLFPFNDEKWAYDYYSKTDGEPLESPYFGLLPSEGTYIIYNHYYEIKDEHWSRGIVLPLPNDDRVHYEHYVYKQKDSSKHKKMIDLTEDDFDFLYKKYIDKATIETLPFGTYMMKDYFPRLNRIDGPFIISIEKD